MPASANTAKLIISDLDFDSIKNNMITFFKSQNTFTSYDFTGSAIQQIMNLLAYNTHYLSFYLNMAINEGFIDTAVLYPNIVSQAKLRGYTPRSITASQAVVTVQINKANGDPTTALTMPAGTSFASALLNGQSYNFVTTDTLTVANVNNTFTFANVTIAEGQLVSKTYYMDIGTNPTQTFPLNDATIDTSTLSVSVQVSNTNIQANAFTYADDATAVGADSNVYYLDIGPDGSYSIYFGDGIIGAQLEDGNLVNISYISTSGDASNQINAFALQSLLLSGSTSNVTTVSPSAGGSPAESGASIKFAAPKSYLAQNRAVTVNDYTSMINKLYPYFQAVTVWGGEQMNPPVYGKVFISALPLTGFVVTQTQQQFLTQQVLAPVSVLTVLADYVQADIDFLNYNINIYYNPTNTTKTANQISTLTVAGAQTWSAQNLNQFNNMFRLSQLTSALDAIDPSITSSSVDVFIQKRITPTLGVTATYVMNTGNPLIVGTTTKNRLYSSPSFQQNDNGGVQRDCYIEEVPESTTGIQQILIVNPGFGYTAPPTITILGDGQGANAYPVIVNGKLNNIIVDAPGAEYTTAQVQISGGGGSGAVLQAYTTQTLGTLRSYFFDDNNIKTVMSANVGSINYATGQITLTNFNPINVANPSGTFSVYARPLNDNFGSSLNLILTQDTSDPAAIAVTVNVDTGN